MDMKLGILAADARGSVFSGLHDGDVHVIRQKEGSQVYVIVALRQD